MTKTNTGLVSYCHAQLGKPYWYGTFGQTATKALYDYNKGRLPAYYTATDFASQFGRRVHDCIGLVKGYLWSDSPDSPPRYATNGCPDVSADRMYQLCNRKGDTIRTLPEVLGLLVFMPAHVGVYIGGGEVIEARGHAYGVVKTKLDARPWQTWGYCPYITYEEELHMTITEFLESLTPAQAYAIEQKARQYAATLPPDDYAVEACRKGVISGIFSDGDGNGLIDAPQAAVKRQELAAVLDRKGLLG